MSSPYVIRSDSDYYQNPFSPPPTGANGDVDAAAHFITAMFSSCSHRPVYHHYTTATDAANVEVVFHMVVDQISKDYLESVQLL